MQEAATRRLPAAVGEIAFGVFEWVCSRQVVHWSLREGSLVDDRACDDFVHLKRDKLVQLIEESRRCERADMQALLGLKRSMNGAY